VFRPRLLLAPLLLLCLNAAADTTDLRLLSATAGLTVPAGYTTIDVRFANYSSAPASDVTITVTIPNGATYEGSNADPNFHNNCTEPPLESPGTLVCKVPSMPSSWATNEIHPSDLVVLARIDSTVTPGTVITFPVAMTGSNAAVPSQSANAALTVAAPADLTIAVNTPAEVTAGDIFVSVITLTNNGPADAIEPSVGMSESSAEVLHITGPPGWDCSATFCRNSTMSPGAAQFVVTTFIPISVGASLMQKFTANGSNDPNYANNSATTTSTVVGSTPNIHPTPPPNRRRGVHH
jgi:hypothetical protein